MGEQQRLAGIEHLARAYFKLLSSVYWNDPLLVDGLREGLNKFLSNAYLASYPGRNKYHKTHLASPAALQRLEQGLTTGLVCEHLVPKRRYIQAPCESRARTGELQLAFIVDRLHRFWHLATITTDEDRLLSRVRMPENWDGNNALARYEEAGLTLVPNPFFEGLAPVADRT